MKKNRHLKILEIISDRNIYTQEELQKALVDCGINVTQATVSRDINELNLVKVEIERGEYRYEVSNENEKIGRFYTIFLGSVKKIDYALNTVVIKCENGMAQGACAAFDLMNYCDVVGTIAGDDTFFVLMRSAKSAEELQMTLEKQLIK